MKKLTTLLSLAVCLVGCKEVKPDEATAQYIDEVREFDSLSTVYLATADTVIERYDSLNKAMEDYGKVQDEYSKSMDALMKELRELEAELNKLDNNLKN